MAAVDIGAVVADLALQAQPILAVGGAVALLHVTIKAIKWCIDALGIGVASELGGYVESDYEREQYDAVMEWANDNPEPEPPSDWQPITQEDVDRFDDYYSENDPRF